MKRPDFGEHVTEFNGVKLSCRYVAPGLTMHDLVMIFERAKAEAAPGDELQGNPSKWPETRGVSAVLEAILSAVYDDRKES